MNTFLDEICGNCGKRFGSHLGYATDKYPNNYCPDPDPDPSPDPMEWENGPGTVFKSTNCHH